MEIRIEGAHELSESFRAFGQTLPRALTEGIQEELEAVARETRPKVHRVTGAAAGSIRVQATQDGARLTAGGPGARHFGWRDFGGLRRGRGGGVAELGYRPGGRYVWKTFGDRRAEAMRALDAAVADAGRTAGLEVVTHG